MNYNIYLPQYSHRSGGIRALYKLADILLARGYDVGDNDGMAIYPEIVFGNPFSAKKVIRWCLNAPGKLNGEGRYDPNELVFTWDRSYVDLPQDRILRVNIIEDFFTNRGLDRNGGCYWLGKGGLKGYVPGAEVSGMTEINYSYPAEREDVANLLNRTEVFYTYDDCTSLIKEALLCGCKVIQLPENIEIKEFKKVDFDKTVDNFIKVTQSWANEY